MKCANCGAERFERVEEPLTLTPTDGVVFDTSLPADRCLACGEVYFDARYIAALSLTSAAQLLEWGISTPAALRHARRSIGMSREAAAALVKVSASDVMTWETGKDPSAPAAYVRALRNAVEDARHSRVPIVAHLSGATAEPMRAAPVLTVAREVHVPVSVARDSVPS